jgi:hypothetical protein
MNAIFFLKKHLIHLLLNQYGRKMHEGVPCVREALRKGSQIIYIYRLYTFLFDGICSQLYNVSLYIRFCNQITYIQSKKKN